MAQPCFGKAKMQSGGQPGGCGARFRSVPLGVDLAKEQSGTLRLHSDTSSFAVAARPRQERSRLRRRLLLKPTQRPNIISEGAPADIEVC